MSKHPTVFSISLFAVLALYSLEIFACAVQEQHGKPDLTTPAARDYRWSQIAATADFPRSYNFPVFTLRDKMYAMLGEGVWSSTDGNDWDKSRLIPIRRNVYSGQYVQFKDSIYHLGDHDGNYERIRFVPKVSKTDDMQKWETLGERTQLPGRIFPGTVVFRDRMWLIGGYDTEKYYNDVWSSTDGINWTRETSNAGWSPRSSMQLTVYKDQLWLLGGGTIDGTPNPNPESSKEIWYSRDGKTWNKHEHALPVTAGGTPIVFDGKLWLVGANRDGVFGRASLITDDLKNWVELPAPWSPRGGVAVWEFNGKLLMTGGKYSYTENGHINFVYSNDVWEMSTKSN